MALVLKDRVKETCTSPGTGTVTLLGASAGYSSFSSIGNANTTYYCISDQTGNNWEVGLGTYTSSGTTLTRNTVFSNSAGTTAFINFNSGTQDVFCTYPSETAAYLNSTGTTLLPNSLIIETPSINTPIISGATSISGATTFGSTVTLNADPTLALQAATKAYVDNATSAALIFHQAVQAASVSAFNEAATVYNNGVDGVGATLTRVSSFITFVIDGVTPSVGQRVMIKDQTTQSWNGIYTVTATGSPSVGFVLTRATDADTYGSGPNQLSLNSYFFIQNGTVNKGTAYVLSAPVGTITFGTSNIQFAEFSSSQVYTGTAPINVTGTVISLTGTVAATNGGTGTSTVTTGDLLYGSAANTWSKLPVGAANKSLVVNGAGTQVEWNAVSLSAAGAVSGSLPATNGGTGLNSYTTGDLIYSSATNTLSKLAGNTSVTKQFLNQTGTGSASAAPVWGTIAAGDVPTLNQNTTGSAGSVANALTAGTGLTASATYNGSAAITFDATGTTINSKTGAYVLLATDAGKTISITTGGVTIPASVLAAGNIVTIYNNSGSSQTITQGSGLTLQWAGQTTSSTGNRTLGLYGMATLVFISATNAVITGAGLT